jgi:hypothetical protein
MVYEKPYAYLEPMCASENCQWCGDPYFAVSAISIGDILPQIPRQGKHKSFLSNQGFVESQFNVSAQSLIFE